MWADDDMTKGCRKEEEEEEEGKKALKPARGTTKDVCRSSVRLRVRDKCEPLAWLVLSFAMLAWSRFHGQPKHNQPQQNETDPNQPPGCFPPTVLVLFFPKAFYSTNLSSVPANAPTSKINNRP